MVEPSPTSHAETTLGSVDDALDNYIKRVQPFIALLASLLYGLITLSHTFLLRGTPRLVLGALTMTSAVWYTMAWQRLRHQEPLNTRSLMFFLWLPLWLNSLLHILLTYEIHQTTNLLLAMIASGLFVIWRRWFMVAFALQSAGWIIVGVLMYTEPLYLHYSFSMLFFAAITWTIFNAQNYMVRDSWESRDKVYRRELELKIALGHLKQEQEKKDVALRELYTQTARLQEILSTAPVLVCLLDQSGQVLNVEGQSAELFSEHLLQPRASWVGNHNIEPLKPLVTKAKSEGEAAGTVHLFDRIWNARLRLVAKDDQQPLFLIAVLYDTTELHESQQMRDHFVSMVSHELRTPLTAINGSLKLMSSGMRLGDDQREKMLALMQRNTERLQKIINDLLDLNKLKAGELKFVYEEKELLPILGITVETLTPYAEQYNVELQLSHKLSDGTYFVDIDEQRLQQVVTNLLSNAIKFSPPHKKVELVVEQAKRKLKVSIYDRGPGVAAEMQDKIFEPFVQESVAIQRTKGGTGLGLSLSKQFVRHMGGDMGYESRDIGACFWFSLPIARVVET